MMIFPLVGRNGKVPGGHGAFLQLNTEYRERGRTQPYPAYTVLCVHSMNITLGELCAESKTPQLSKRACSLSGSLAGHQVRRWRGRPTVKQTSTRQTELRRVGRRHKGIHVEDGEARGGGTVEHSPTDRCTDTKTH